MKLKPKTEKQIAAEIKKLEELKPNVRRKDIFGGDNIEKLDAVLRVLKENLSEDKIYDEWDVTEEEFGDRNQEIVNTASQARRWMDGEEEERPSEGWPLNKKS